MCSSYTFGIGLLSCYAQGSIPLQSAVLLTTGNSKQPSLHTYCYQLCSMQSHWAALSDLSISVWMLVLFLLGTDSVWKCSV